jgi:hypothetical protein
MRKTIQLALLLFTFTVMGNSQTPTVNKSNIQVFTTGGVSIKIPLPDTAFSEVGTDNRESMGILVAKNNRLLSAYVLKNDLPFLFKGGNNTIMSKYALLEIPREAEGMDCEADDFKQVTDGAKEAFSDIASLIKVSEDEFNHRMEALDLTNMKLEIGQTERLGVFFSKPDIIGLGMIMGYEMGGSAIKMGMTAIILRVKKRLLFIYLYSEYKSDETISWLRSTGEKWSDEILKANKL